MADKVRCQCCHREVKGMSQTMKCPLHRGTWCPACYVEFHGKWCDNQRRLWKDVDEVKAPPSLDTQDDTTLGEDGRR